MQDQNPGADGAGEGAEDLELELEGSPEGTEPTELGGDPLDDIQDPVARAEAKKWRAIARRKDEPKVEAPVVTAPTPEFLTKADFFKSNEKNAIREATADPEVKANWSDIVPFYTPRRGKETKEDILEDIKDAIILYKARNPEVVTDDSANQLTASPVVKSGGGVADKVTPKPNNPPNFKLPTPPNQWYKKSES